MQLMALQKRSCAWLTPRHLWPLLVWFLMLEDPQIVILWWNHERNAQAGFCIDWFEKTEKDDTVSPTPSDAEAEADFETTPEEEEHED